MSDLKSGRDVLRQAKQNADWLEPDQVHDMLAKGEKLVLVDVRESDEWRDGRIPNAVHIPRGYLEMQVDERLPNRDAELVVYCAGGNRSPLAAATLQELGYNNVRVMAGGYSQWSNLGFEVVKPRQWTKSQRDRYSRHFVLPEVGEQGQTRISSAKMLVVGAGGLGSPALYYLAAAGVGHLGIVDFDSVEENNLQRQIIHSTSRIGENKAASAKRTIEDLNPDVVVETFEERLSAENVDDIVSRYDLVIDATDNFDTRYLLNESAVKHAKPYVYGSIFRFEGYASVFWPERGGPCYRCMHPEPPPAALAPT